MLLFPDGRRTAAELVIEMAIGQLSDVADRHMNHILALWCVVAGLLVLNSTLILYILRLA